MGPLLKQSDKCCETYCDYYKRGFLDGSESITE